MSTSYRQWARSYRQWARHTGN